jgi:uncharacterized repeat protein (TIGR01451 family)
MSRGSTYALGAVAKRSLVLLATALLLATMLFQYAVVTSPQRALASSVTSATLDQCANGKAGSSRLACTGARWQNGNLNENNSQYREGDSVSFRALITVPVGSHSIWIQFDNTKASAHAYDYLTGWDATETGDPTSGAGTLLGGTSTLPITTPSNAFCSSGFHTPPAIVSGSFTLWGGTLTGMSYTAPGGGANSGIPSSCTGDQSVTVQVDFTTTADGNLVLAWGGHIGSELNWGVGNSAVAISGSPYHQRILKVDSTTIGNQDRSLKASAVLVPPTIATQVSSSTISVGQTVTDTVTVSGPVGTPTGTVVFRLCASAAGCPTGGTQVGAAKTLSGGTATSDPVPSNLISTAGTYCFGVDYTPASNSQYTAGSHTNTDTECFVVQAPAIHIVKTPDAPTVSAGGTVGFTVTVSNSGAGTATGVSAADTLPTNAGLAWSIDTANSGAGWSISGGVLAWTGSLASGASSSVHITSPTTSATCGTVDNTASVTTGNDGSDTSSASVAVECAPALNLEKQVSVNGGAYAHTGSANPGDTLTYRLTITNTGNADATGETVTDNLSGVLAHATWNASASASSGSPSFSDPNLTWSGISIAANGGTATLTFSVTLDQTGWAAGSTDLPNVAVEANSGNCPTATSEDPHCSTNTTVTTGTSLGITKSVDPSTITGGASTDVSYTIVVSNSGSGDTTGNVLVTDNDFPTFYSISGVTCTPTNATCDATHLNGTGIDLGTIAAGASVTITVSGTASPNNTSDLGDHVNTANACEQVVEGQPVCVSAQATLTVTLSHNPAIHIVKTPSTTVTPTGGGPVTYTYVVTNTGNVPLSNVTVTDNKCSSVTYVDGDTSDNGLLDLTETWTFTCTTTLTATTTNIGTANGYDGDTKVSDSDTATVTVPVVPPPPPPNPPTPTPTPTPSGTVLPTATAQLTLPPTSTLDGSSPSSQSGNGLLLILGVVGLVMLLLGLIAPAPARARQRSRRR